jgi:hypothetical protein
MKRSRLLVVVVVLLLVALVPVLAMAQSMEKVGTTKLVKGERATPITGAPKAAEQLDTAKNVPGAANQVLPASEAEKMGLAPDAPDAILHKIKEGYEGVWPNGLWFTFDNNGSGNGSYCWDDDDYLHKKGYWSAWAANGCADGLDPQYYYYPNNTDSWMVYGPVSTVGAKAGNVKFSYWNNSEFGWDYFYWCASVDYSNWYCNYHTGSTNNKWKTGKLNLKKVPGYGSMLGYNYVYIAFVFQSDSIVVSDGPFVDEVSITVKGN